MGSFPPEAQVVRLGARPSPTEYASTSNDLFVFAADQLTLESSNRPPLDMLSSFSILGLPPLALCALLVAAGIVVPLVYTVLRASLSPLRALPGPPLARYTKWWYLRAVMKRDFHETNIKLHQKEGKFHLVTISLRSQYRSHREDCSRSVFHR